MRLNFEELPFETCFCCVRDTCPEEDLKVYCVIGAARGISASAFWHFSLFCVLLITLDSG